MRKWVSGISLIKKVLYLIIFTLIVVLVSFSVTNAVAQRTVDGTTTGLPSISRNQPTCRRCNMLYCDLYSPIAR